MKRKDTKIIQLPLQVSWPQQNDKQICLMKYKEQRKEKEQREKQTETYKSLAQFGRLLPW